MAKQKPGWWHGFSVFISKWYYMIGTCLGKPGQDSLGRTYPLLAGAWPPSVEVGDEFKQQSLCTFSRDILLKTVFFFFFCKHSKLSAEVSTAQLSIIEMEVTQNSKHLEFIKEPFPLEPACSQGRGTHEKGLGSVHGISVGFMTLGIREGRREENSPIFSKHWPMA